MRPYRVKFVWESIWTRRFIAVPVYRFPCIVITRFECTLHFIRAARLHTPNKLTQAANTTQIAWLSAPMKQTKKKKKKTDLPGDYSTWPSTVYQVPTSVVGVGDDADDDRLIEDVEKPTNPLHVSPES